jgi:hypothetical protein
MGCHMSNIPSVSRFRGPQGPRGLSGVAGAVGRAGDPGDQGAPGAPGTPGVDATIWTVATSSVAWSAAQPDPADPTKARAATDLRRDRFSGVFTTSGGPGTDQPIQHAGPVSPIYISLGVGLATAVGVTSAGVPCRVTDSTCASSLNFLGWCDTAGTITIAPRFAERYEWSDYGLVADWNGSTGTDNLPAMVAMLAAMKRDAIAAGSLNKIQVAHFTGYFYFGDTIHIQQGVQFIGDGRSNPFLHPDYHWSPGTQFTFPDGCHKLRFHSQGDFDELNPAPGAPSIALSAVSNVLDEDVEFTTAAPHGLIDGDVVCVSILKVLSAVYPSKAGANKLSGTWTVRVTGASKFKVEEPGHPETLWTGNGDTVTGRAIVKCTVPWTNPFVGGGYPSAAYSQIQGIVVYGTPNAYKSGDGLRVTCPVVIRDVHVEGCGGDGFSITGDHTASGSNANGWLIEGDCTVGDCGGHGLRVSGGDTNGGLASHINFAGTWGHAIYDAYNQGAKYVACQADSCGGDRDELGPYCEYYSDGVTCESVFDTCYAENGVSVIKAPSMVIGGILASPTRTDSRTSGWVLSGGGSFRGALRQFDYSYLPGGLIAALGSDDGSGSLLDWTQIGASYIRWKLVTPHGVIYSEVGGSSSSRAIGIPFSANAIRTGLGASGVVPIMQNGIAYGEVGFNPRFDDWGTAPPTDGNRRQGDKRTNTVTSVISDFGGDYVVDHWRCIADATHTGPGESAADYDGGVWVAIKGVVLP